MIGCWPDPRPGELFYSNCARYSERVRYPSRRSVVTELFGTENAIACVSLPSHLDYFIAQLPPRSNLDAERIIDEHTLLPFFAPFLPLERHLRLRQDMCSSNGLAIHMRAGLMASHVPLPQWLRFCPRCVEEDRRRFGECYWHRVHQVLGVEICPLHKEWVRNSAVRAQNVQTRYEFISAEAAIGETFAEEIDGNEQFFEILFALALDSQWLLNQRGLSQDLSTFQHRYRRQLADLGLSTYRGRVDRNALLSKFKDMYAPEILRLLHCELDECIEDNWLVRLAHKPDNAQHPLHHLLLIHCLEQTAEAFFHLPAEDKPFGTGPWPCLNPACNHFRQAQIEECHIIHSQHVGGKPIGTFACSCGYTYSRTGPDKSVNDHFSFNRVKSFGYQWEARLRFLWNDETVSLRGMARQLGVDPLTVKRHASRIGLSFPRPVGTCKPLKEVQQLHLDDVQVSETSTLEMNRNIWLATVQKNPKGGISKVREKIPKIYTWLYRNDRHWLKAHTPLCKEEKARRTHVNWDSRDKELAEKVKLSASNIKNGVGKPVRVTITAIGREIGQLALIQQHLDRLPLTSQALREVVETREGFAIRRIWWIVEQYRQKDSYPKQWELIKDAGVERVASDVLVQEAICKALSSSCE